MRLTHNNHFLAEWVGTLQCHMNNRHSSRLAEALKPYDMTHTHRKTGTSQQALFLFFSGHSLGM